MKPGWYQRARRTGDIGRVTDNGSTAPSRSRPSRLWTSRRIPFSVSSRIPSRPGHWDRRGLVVGHIQSGKTGHYIGLVCKAADAGYKIVIVLAGLHNNLRSQTQMRLDEGFSGLRNQTERGRHRGDRRWDDRYGSFHSPELRNEPHEQR